MDGETFTVAASVDATVQYTALSDVEGRFTVLVPTVQVEQLKRLGLGRLNLTLAISPEQSTRAMMTVTEAAEAHRQQFHWLTLPNATIKVSRACKAGRLPSTGFGRRRRIALDAFQVWHAQELTKDAGRDIP